MNILIIAPVHRENEFLKQKGKYPFLKGQGQQSWVDALEELGHEVFIFRYTDSILIPQILRVYVLNLFQKFLPVWKARYDRFRSAYYFISLENYLRNKSLLSLSYKVNPQLVIISGGITSIYPKSIRAIKDRLGCKILLFSGTNPLVSSTVIENIIVKKRIIDSVIENDKGYGNFWKKIGAKRVIVLPISSVDPKLHRKVKLKVQEQKEYGCDVCFVGTLTSDRQEKLVQLTKFDLKVWGDIVPTVGLLENLKPFYYGKAYGEKMVRIFNAAKIVLNFQPKDMTNGGNMRTFEIPGCGSFQLADKIDPNFFVNTREYISFRDVKDLKKKISYYLNHEKEREKIANEGFKKAHVRHTYKDHFNKLLQII